MTFDLYADLAALQVCPKSGPLPCGLVSGFIDGCTAFSVRDGKDKNDARNCYTKHAKSAGLYLEGSLALDSDPQPLLRDWLAITVTFTLAGPWYSKDDRPFQVLDNPLRKDRVFGVPFMAASSWKGLLRWAMGMTTGLIGPDPVKDERKRREAELAVRHLFGNEKGASDCFKRGALAFYPTWFSKIGFEVISPHSRKTRAGTQPILYEVVPAGTEGTLKLLYAPLPDAERPAQLDPPAALCILLDAVRDLLTAYGFSAKRTAGWGVATIKKVTVIGRAGKEAGSLEEAKAALPMLLSGEPMR